MAEQVSNQAQGEAQELAIEEWLHAEFPFDDIEEIKKVNAVPIAFKLFTPDHVTTAVKFITKVNARSNLAKIGLKNSKLIYKQKISMLVFSYTSNAKRHGSNGLKRWSLCLYI